MIYINQTPFVLRDEDQPLENIRRYQGINSNRLEQVEARLKEDILSEARKNDGLVLVHDEIGMLFIDFLAYDQKMEMLYQRGRQLTQLKHKKKFSKRSFSADFASNMPEFPLAQIKLQRISILMSM
jgi:hypothetical protein